MTDEPVLDLNTLIERPKIAVDGALYEILSPEELSVIEHARFAAAGRKLEALMGLEALTAEQETELRATLRQLTDRIMAGVPPGVRAKLGDGHRLQVAEVFTALPWHRALKALAAAGAEIRSTGAKRRPGSNGSTAATPAGGSTRRRSRSSAPIS